MKRLRHLLPVVLATGCYGGYYVETTTTTVPASRTEYVTYQPGYIWVNGYWRRDAGHWYWQNGYYLRERPNYTFVQPRWERHGNTYIFVEGHWQPHARTSTGVYGYR